MPLPPAPHPPVAFPLALDAEGHTAAARTARAAAEQLIEEVLFTNPGERLNRPTFGSGLLKLVFGAATEELRTATQFQVSAQLQHWLPPTIVIAGVQVGGTGPEIDITVSYRLAGIDGVQTASFTR
jgi:phage baseplate assembly protein W